MYVLLYVPFTILLEPFLLSNLQHSDTLEFLKLLPAMTMFENVGVMTMSVFRTNV